MSPFISNTQSIALAYHENPNHLKKIQSDHYCRARHSHQLFIAQKFVYCVFILLSKQVSSCHAAPSKYSAAKRMYTQYKVLYKYLKILCPFFAGEKKNPLKDPNRMNPLPCCTKFH